MEIKSARYISSSPAYRKCPAPDRPEFAFIGRSNVGKSSLINMLCNNKRLAKTSATPGKTQTINHFEVVSKVPGQINKEWSWYLVDLPGYGYAARSQASRRQWKKMIEDYIRKRENLSCLFVLIDSRHPPQAIDVAFVNQLQNEGIFFALIFTKADKNKPDVSAENAETFIRRIGLKGGGENPFFITSAIKKTGRQQILDFIAAVINNLNS